MMADTKTHRHTGDLCKTSNGREIIWNGHLCEGADLTAPTVKNFCLWTRCGHHDVPEGKVREGDIREVQCSECLEVWNEENGQFGAGA